MIYHFPPIGLKKIKAMIIDLHIDLIKNWDVWEQYVKSADVMKTRETTINLILFQYTKKISENVQSYSQN